MNNVQIYYLEQQKQLEEVTMNITKRILHLVLHSKIPIGWDKRMKKLGVPYNLIIREHLANASCQVVSRHDSVH